MDNPSDRPHRILPRVRQRDTLQELHERLAVPYARDHAACSGTLPSPSQVADRFVPCRSREEDIDDFRSPKRMARESVCTMFSSSTHRTLSGASVSSPVCLCRSRANKLRPSTLFWPAL